MSYCWLLLLLLLLPCSVHEQPYKLALLSQLLLPLLHLQTTDARGSGHWAS